jgi:hypothetical protein
MKGRMLRWCLMAFPSKERNKDGEMLRDLALELETRNGLAREALGLIRCGLGTRATSVRERWISGRSRAAKVAWSAAAALVALTVAIPFALGDDHAQLDRFSCTPGACGTVQEQVQARELEGWDCGPGGVDQRRGEKWTCTQH